MVLRFVGADLMGMAQQHEQRKRSHAVPQRLSSGSSPQDGEYPSRTGRKDHLVALRELPGRRIMKIGATEARGSLSAERSLRLQMRQHLLDQLPRRATPIRRL